MPASEEEIDAGIAGVYPTIYLPHVRCCSDGLLTRLQEYVEAGDAYDGYLADYPDHAERPLALWQAGLAHERAGRTGDAVDRWENLVRRNPSAEIAEKAWARAGTLPRASSIPVSTTSSSSSIPMTSWAPSQAETTM